MSLDDAVETRLQTAVPDDVALSEEEGAVHDISDLAEPSHGFLWCVAAVQLVWIGCLAYAVWLIVA